MCARKYYLYNLGCKVNSYELIALGKYLSSFGFSETHDPAEAKLILINTCAVTSKAEQKSRQHIHSFRRKFPNAFIYVMGCQSELHLKENKESGASFVTGICNRLSSLKEVIALLDDGTLPNEALGYSERENVRLLKYEELGNAACLGKNTRVYLKIQDGCDNFCSYCYIPFIRGNSRSRAKDEIIEEAKEWTALGYKEIVLSGIHIGGYGKDLGDGSYRIADLIEDILANCPSLYSLRISSIEESEIDDKFIGLLKRHPNVANHLHVPLQSGSKTVLKRMKRKYDTEAFLKKIEMIRAARHDIAITTDVIVGFPGESEEEFLETMSFCKTVGFSEIHVFPFSSRPFTFASTLKDLDPRIKKERVSKLMELSKTLWENYRSAFFGKTLKVLFEEYDSKQCKALGHTSNYLPIEIPSDCPLDGQVIDVIYESKQPSNKN